MTTRETWSIPLSEMLTSRRRFCAALSVLALAVLPGCERKQNIREVVLYTSSDDYLLRDILPAFERESGISVKPVADTEATKDVGLVQRLLSEKERPRADVWWSNEPFGTIKLAEAGVLTPYTSSAEKEFEGGWPREYRGRDGMWYGFGLRACVIAYNTGKLDRATAPSDLLALSDPRWKSRIGMADPHFGSTRGRLGAVLAMLGPDRFRLWVRGLKANDTRLFYGNSAVVRAVAEGRIHLGLTDSDDVYNAQREQWAVGLVWPATTSAEPGGSLGAAGPLPLPNTVAFIKGAPHPREAAVLIDFLLSERVERMLAISESRNTPVRPRLAAEFKDLALPSVPAPDFALFQSHTSEAIRIWDESFGP